ncbi:hypothetical protein AB9P32_005482 [Pseudomonas aeruginosa]|uniref:hypothetical protein n=1 Tax=Pseudomonas aeruginosa TaxID=287 RepID=UPI00155DBF20|nr:hypothetical protein [Pseudomonas aeruginosa]EKF8207453.1 hypothetical protein [Pseudomonas aeruginosa]EKI0129143.1 hypothetical protein [Pseudomonas aeruginosa]EMD6030762.1 hypothetical protein [Pseudomonas aeruginosa]QCO95628.1 Hypothetical protein [Pseudomonas aeruginosa]HBO3040576.1 hypothetical protein [Pseudomonas aeruginosa]
MDNTENVDERLLAAVMDEAQTDFSIASIAVEKIRQGAESIAAGMHGRNHVKASFEHHDGTPMSPEEALAHQCVHAASIGKSLGQEFGVWGAMEPKTNVSSESHRKGAFRSPAHPPGITL